MNYIDARQSNARLLMDLRAIWNQALGNRKQYRYLLRRNHPIAKSLARKIRKLEKRAYWPLGRRHRKGEGWFMQPMGIDEYVGPYSWSRPCLESVDDTLQGGMR